MKNRVLGLLLGAFLALLGGPGSCQCGSDTAKGGLDTSHRPGTAQTETLKLPSLSQSRRPKVGLALGGGGTRGAAHVGVLKVLQKEGIPIDMIVGTSMGSVVGGLYSSGMPLDKIEKEFTDTSLMKSFMTVSLPVRVVASPVMVLPRLFGAKPYDGLYYGNKFRNYLTKSLPSCERNIEDLKIPYSAVVTDVEDGSIHLISKGNLGYAMQASCAVPGLRKPVEIDGQLFVDGGVVANVPVKQARDKGADIVIAVNVDERVLKEPLDSFRHIGAISKRMLKLQLAAIDQPQCKLADIIIHPNVDGISLVSTKKKDLLRAVSAGEEAARQALPQIKQTLSQVGICNAGDSTH